jgi:hypothetical protein
VQEAHVLAVRTPGLLRHQRVVGPAEGHRRVQLLAIDVAGKRPRLPHQPVDHVPVVDPMLRLTTQPLHGLHPLPRVPHLEHLGTQAHFHPLPDQARRHRVRVLLHLDRAPLAYLGPLPLQRLQTTPRQRTQPPCLGPELVPAARVPPRPQDAHELQVRLTAGEVAAPTQQQSLLQRLLETPVALLAIAVLVTAVRIGGLGRQAVVPQQRLVPGRVTLGVAVVMHRQRHPVGAMPLGHAAQFPQGVLQALAQAGEALREAQRHVLPVRAGQHEVVQQVRKRLALDGHAQAVQVREVRGAQPARLMHLAEEDFLGRPVLGLPLPHPPLQRPPVPVPVLLGLLTRQPVQQRFGLQARLPAQQFLQTGPHRGERIGPGTPGVGRAPLAGQLAEVTVLPCGLAIHVGLHRCLLERCSLVKVASEFLDLRIADLTSCSHRQLLGRVKLPG